MVAVYCVGIPSAVGDFCFLIVDTVVLEIAPDATHATFHNMRPWRNGRRGGFRLYHLSDGISEKKQQLRRQFAIDKAAPLCIERL